MFKACYILDSMGNGHKYISKFPNEKGLIEWDQLENQTWEKLITRQREIIKNRACDEFIHGLELIQFSQQKVPQPKDVNERLMSTTGWQIKPVEALIPAEEFFTLLANKTFPAACFIRIPEELDYIQEPDIFHELYGHCPLLTNQVYANFMFEFGKLALKASPKDRRRLFRIFWFTIEFGMINTKNGLRAYGGGILSSINETVYCTDSPIPVKMDFDPLNSLRTPYRIDIIQPLYYVINSFDDLYNLLNLDLLEMVQESKKLGDFNPLFKIEGSFN